MKRSIFCLILIFLISCSNNELTEQETNVEANNLEISYSGYYQVVFGEPYQNDIYDNITISPITFQTSPTATIDLLKIHASSTSKGNKSDNFISFNVLANTIGNDALYDNHLSFKSHGATYYTSKLYFKVLTNNEIGFSAAFSGKLKHWYEGENRYVYLDISKASVSILY